MKAGPLTDAELARLQALLDKLPAPLEPLDTSALDGFLCGVLLQPQPVSPARWLRYVTDAEGRDLPPAAFAARAAITRPSSSSSAAGACRSRRPGVLGEEMLTMK